MDRPRQAPRSRARQWLAMVAIALGLAGVVAAGFVGGDPKAPIVAERSIRTATVERGELVRSVRGPGSLVPEQIQWITATGSARVEAIEIEAGAEVGAETVLVRLRNPDLELAALEAHSELAAARAELANLEASLETGRLEQEAAIAQVESAHAEASRVAKGNESLAERSAISSDELARGRERARELDARLDIEQKRLGVLRRARKAQVAAQAARVTQLQAVVDFREGQLVALDVVAKTAGVLQTIEVEPGQWVTPGTVLAKVVRPDRLEARLRIPEVRAKDIRVGQRAIIDMRSETLEGEVSRVDPAVTDGNVIVDVALAGPLPAAARPDLSVDGVIELERLPDVVWVRRPAQAEGEQTLGLFVREGDRARRVSVELGRASVDAIEVVSGLEVGDEVIVSDVSAWQDRQEIYIER